MADLPITSDEGATPIVINDPTTTANVANVKAASTAAVATDASLVVALSPNSPVPTGTNKIGVTGVTQGSTTSGQNGNLEQGAVTTSAPTYVTGQTSPLSLTTVGNLRVDGSSVTQPVSGTVTANQGTANTLANAWSEKITDGTNGPVAVKAASTAALATDPALVVALSPNSPLPIGTNAIGSVIVSSIVNNSDKNGTGTITALNGTVVAATNGCASVSFNVTGTWVATITVQATSDGTNWNVVNCNILATDIITQTFANNEFLVVPCGGFQQVRLIATAFTSGTASIAWNAGAGSSPVFTSISPVAASFQTTARLNDGSGNSISSTAGSLNVDVTIALPAGTNTIGKIEILGNAGGTLDAAQNATAPANELVSGGVYNSTLPSLSSGNATQLQTDVNGRLIVAAAPLDGYKATYSAAVVGLVTAATATDVFTITGSATKTIRITRVEITGTTTSGSGVSFSLQLIKRSAANTGGTSAAATAVPHDSNDAAATASAVSYTVNPTALGAAVGTIRTQRIEVNSTAVTPFDVPFDFGTRPSQAVVLRGTSQILAINFNSTTITGPVIDIDIEWTEE